MRFNDMIDALFDGTEVLLDLSESAGYPVVITGLSLDSVVVRFCGGSVETFLMEDVDFHKI